MSGVVLFIIVGTLFIGIGTFSVILSHRRRKHGLAPVWYKDITFLTGIEYLLLSLIIFLNLSRPYIPAMFLAPFYLAYITALVLAVIFLIAVAFTMLRKSRQPQPVVQTATEAVTEEAPSNEVLQHKRQRRQNAAAARRRQAGKA